MSHEDIQHLQSVGRDAQAAKKDYILTDDQDKVWSHIEKLEGTRIDFVLDNGLIHASLLCAANCS